MLERPTSQDLTELAGLLRSGDPVVLSCFEEPRLKGEEVLRLKPSILRKFLRTALNNPVGVDTSLLVSFTDGVNNGEQLRVSLGYFLFNAIHPVSVVSNGVCSYHVLGGNDFQTELSHSRGPINLSPHVSGDDVVICMLVVRDFNYLSMEISILEDAVLVVGNNCHPVL